MLFAKLLKRHLLFSIPCTLVFELFALKSCGFISHPLSSLKLYECFRLAFHKHAATTKVSFFTDLQLFLFLTSKKVAKKSVWDRCTSWGGIGNWRIKWCLNVRPQARPDRNRCFSLHIGQLWVCLCCLSATKANSSFMKKKQNKTNPYTFSCTKKYSEIMYVARFSP